MSARNPIPITIRIPQWWPCIYQVAIHALHAAIGNLVDPKPYPFAHQLDPNSLFFFCIYFLYFKTKEKV